jgi:bleomycin hydrolase
MNDDLVHVAADIRAARDSFEALTPRDKLQERELALRLLRPSDGDMSTPTALDAHMAGSAAAELFADPRSRLARNVISNDLAGSDTFSNFQNLLIDRSVRVASDHVFSDVLAREGKPTSQKSSGRCWMFAALNVMRLGMMKKWNLPDSFELSHSYLFFYDKIERFNYVLEQILDTLDEPCDSRVLMHLLSAPLMDGGQWDMLANLVAKYGVVPKCQFPETLTSGASRRMNRLLTHKLRQFACELRRAHAEGGGNVTAASLRAERKPAMLRTALRILLVFFGQPPGASPGATFDWCFYDKAKKYRSIRGLTPQRFFAECVPFRCSAQVSLVHDPRNPYFRCYTVARLGNVVGGRDIKYLNVPVEELRRYAAATLLAGEPVWFGCDWGKCNNRPLSLMDPKLLDVGLVFGADAAPDVMDKRARLDYGESLMTHAMIFTGVDLAAPRPEGFPRPTKPFFGEDAAAEKGKKGGGAEEAKGQGPQPTTKEGAAAGQEEAPAQKKAAKAEDFCAAEPSAVPDGFQVKVNKWRVENSHGDRGRGKGYMCMTDCWFDEFLYQVAIDEARLAPRLREALREPPTVLPPWDPLGALARTVGTSDASDGGRVGASL